MTYKSGIAVILAAGRSRRFGHEDKRMSRLPNGNTLLVTVYVQAYELFEQVIVMVRKGETPLALGLPTSACCIPVSNPDGGMGDSLAQAFSELCQHPKYQSVCFAAVLLGDMPFIKNSTLLTLQKKALEHIIVRPSYLSEMGHPVYFGRQFWSQLASLTGDDGAKGVVSTYLDQVDCIELVDQGVVYDIDTQEALQTCFRADC